MSQGGANSSSGSGGEVVETLTGNTGGPVPPSGFNIDILGNNTTGIDVVGTSASNLLTIIGLAASETQIGTIEIATAVETGTLTDNSRAVSPSGLEPILVTPYVVAPGGAYTTIQSAINAANSAGGGMVYLRPGSYTENLTFFDNINLVSVIYENSGDVVITGTHTPPNSGSISIRGCKLIGTNAIFSSAAAGSTNISFEEVTFEVTDGWACDLLNWTGTINVNDAGSSGTEDGVFRNTSGANIFTNNCQVGAGSTRSLTVNGDVRLDLTFLNCPATISSGDLFVNFALFSQTVSLTGDVTGSILLGDFFTGASPCLSMGTSGAISLRNCTLDSTNNPAITGAGAGTLTLTSIFFLNNGNISASLTLGASTVYPVQMADGELLIGSAGQSAVTATITAGNNITITNGPGTITIDASGGGELTYTNVNTSPYTVLSTAQYLGVDVSTIPITLEFPDAPVTGRVIIVKDFAGNAATNNITITSVGGASGFDGSLTYVMNTDFQSIQLLFDGTNYQIF